MTTPERTAELRAMAAAHLAAHPPPPALLPLGRVQLTAADLAGQCTDLMTGTTTAPPTQENT